MDRHYFSPTLHKVYANKNGIKYLCLSSSGKYEAIFQAVTKSKWTFTAHGCQMYSDGKIEWDQSTNGLFVESLSDSLQ